jgi:hypothetical protein
MNTTTTSYDAVIDAVKSQLKIRYDRDLSRRMGLYDGAVGNWRRSGIPPDKIITLHRDFDVPMEILIEKKPQSDG